MKKSIGILAILIMIMLIPVGVASAATYKIVVTPDGDKVYNRSWYSGGNDRWWTVNANPNTVSHRYDPGDGYSTYTSLTFNLGGYTEPVEDIISATFNFDILSVSTEGRDDIGSFSAGGTVLYSGGTGLKSFDITDNLKTQLTSSPGTAGYSLNYTGYSGFTFGSADGLNPAYLSITTSSPVPVPGAIWLLGSGLVGLIGFSRRKK